MAVSGSMQFSSAFSQKMWKPSLENSNIIYEVSKDEEVEEVTEKEVARPKTKFNKLLNNNYQISPIKSAGKSTTSKFEEHKNKILEEYWIPDTQYSKPAEKEKTKFAFIKTGHKRKDQYNFPKTTRVLPLGNYLADDYSVSDSIVLDALAKARRDSSARNIVRTKYDPMELQFFDSPYSIPVVGKAYERAKMGHKTQEDIDIVQTRVLMKKL